MFLLMLKRVLWIAKLTHIVAICFIDFLLLREKRILHLHVTIPDCVFGGRWQRELLYFRHTQISCTTLSSIYPRHRQLLCLCCMLYYIYSVSFPVWLCGHASGIHRCQLTTSYRIRSIPRQSAAILLHYVNSWACINQSRCNEKKFPETGQARPQLVFLDLANLVICIWRNWTTVHSYLVIQTTTPIQLNIVLALSNDEISRGYFHREERATDRRNERQFRVTVTPQLIMKHCTGRSWKDDWTMWEGWFHGW